jgi:hypothetical protein
MGPARRLAALVPALWLAACATPAAVTVRHPEFSPAAIRRPAVLLQVSLDQTGLGEGEFSARERAVIPEHLEARLIDSLNARGLFPVDVALQARRAWRGGAATLEGVDRGAALARGRALAADVLVIVDLRLGRTDLVYCREARRPLRVQSTVVVPALEVLRVADGTRLYLQPAGRERWVTDVEAECGPERSVRRLGLEELAERAVARALSPL